MIFRSNIKELMRKNALTIRELQQKTGLATRTITNARSEQVSACTLATLARFAVVLGCSTKDLYYEEETAREPAFAEAAETPENEYRDSGKQKKRVPIKRY